MAYASPDTDYSLDTDGDAPQRRRPTYKGKVVLVGDFACGKSSLLHRYQTGNYLGIQEPTIAAAFSTKMVDLETPEEPPAIVHSCGEPGVSGRSLQWQAAGSAPPPADKATSSKSFFSSKATASTAVAPSNAASSVPVLQEKQEAVPVHAPMACRVKLELWDTAGSERYNSLMPMYFRDALVALIVFDPSRRSSFERVGKWLDSYRAHNDGSVNDPCLRPVLVCAKSDLFALGAAPFCDPSVEFGGPDKVAEVSLSAAAPSPSPPLVKATSATEVTITDVMRFAEAQQLPVVFTSAKANWNIDVLFRDVAVHIALVARLREGQATSRFGLRNGNALGTFGGSPGSVMLAEDPLQREYATRRERRQAGDLGPSDDTRKRCAC